MHCHVCNVAVDEGQQFCHECGSSLKGVTDPTEPVTSIDTELDDDATIEREQTLPSETVNPPHVPEARPSSLHRGALPDLAGVSDAGTDLDLQSGSASDAWWDGAGEIGPMPQPPTELIESQPGGDRLDSAAMDATGPMDVAPAFEPTTTMPMNEPRTPAFEPTTTMPMTVVPAGQAGFGNTDELPQVAVQQGALFDGAADVTTYPVTESRGFRLRASFVFGVLGLLATLLASAADVVEVRTSRPVDGIEVGLRTMEDFGTNLSIAGIVGAAMMLIGGLLSCFGLRWGAGLSGGSGLAMVGWAAIVLGVVEVPIHDAKLVTGAAGADVNGFTLFITRDLGWFLVLAVAAIGLVVFLASLRMAGTGLRSGLNPWIAAVGALMMVIVAAGPLIPLGGEAFDVNLGTGQLPREFFAARLIQLGLIAATGVLGFLSVRTYGIGFAAGGLGVSVWLWVSSLGELGDPPTIGIAVGNIGTNSTVPHAVTTVGITASLVMIAVAAALAVASRPHRRAP
jgi:hypothetical protein